MGGLQSALAPAGPQASAIASVTWWFFGICALVYVLVIGAAIWAIARRRAASDDSTATARRLGLVVTGAVTLTVAALVVLNAAQAAKAGKPDDKALAARLGAQLKEFPGYAQVRKLAVSPEPWTVDNGLLTSTLKPRRAEIMKRFAVQQDELYRGHK